jgi:hypothetical protein
MIIISCRPISQAPICPHSQSRRRSVAPATTMAALARRASSHLLRSVLRSPLLPHPISATLLRYDRLASLTQLQTACALEGQRVGVKSFPASGLVLDRTRHPRFCFHLFVAFKCWVGLVYSSDAGASPRFLLFWAISRYGVSLLSGFLVKRFLNFRVTGGKWVSV